MKHLYAFAALTGYFGVGILDGNPVVVESFVDLIPIALVLIISYWICRLFDWLGGETA